MREALSSAGETIPATTGCISVPVARNAFSRSAPVTLAGILLNLNPSAVEEHSR